MRYERKEVEVPFGERSIIIETEEERIKFNTLLIDACKSYQFEDREMYDFVNSIRSGD